MSVKDPSVLFGFKIVICAQEETFGRLISTSSFQRREWKMWNLKTTTKLFLPPTKLYFVIKPARTTENHVDLASVKFATTIEQQKSVLTGFFNWSQPWWMD